MYLIKVDTTEKGREETREASWPSLSPARCLYFATFCQYRRVNL